jgi:hypothetical protein
LARGLAEAADGAVVVVGGGASRRGPVVVTLLLLLRLLLLLPRSVGLVVLSPSTETSLTSCRSPVGKARA